MVRIPDTTRTSRQELAPLEDRGHRVVDRQCGELFDMAGEERIAADHEPARFWSEV